MALDICVNHMYWLRKAQESRLVILACETCHACHCRCLQNLLCHGEVLPGAGLDSSTQQQLQEDVLLCLAALQPGLHLQHTTLQLGLGWA